MSRLLRNLKALYLEKDDYEGALDVLRRLILLHPGDPMEARDLGMACLYTRRPRQAVSQLQTYLSMTPRAPDAPVIGALLAEAYRHIERMH